MPQRTRLSQFVYPKATTYVLSALEPKPLAIHGIYQSREYKPAALRAFLDALAQHVFSG